MSPAQFGNIRLMGAGRRALPGRGVWVVGPDCLGLHCGRDDGLCQRAAGEEAQPRQRRPHHAGLEVPQSGACIQYR